MIKGSTKSQYMAKGEFNEENNIDNSHNLFIGDFIPGKHGTEFNYK